MFTMGFRNNYCILFYIIMYERSCTIKGLDWWPWPLNIDYEIIQGINWFIINLFHLRPECFFFALKKFKKILKWPGTDFESHIKSFFEKKWLQKNLHNNFRFLKWYKKKIKEFWNQCSSMLKNWKIIYHHNFGGKSCQQGEHADCQHSHT